MTEAWLGLAGRRVALLGAGAFGQACAMAFVEQGARVVVGDRDEASLAKVRAIAGSSAGGGIDGVRHVEVATSADCQEFVDDTARLLGGIDVLVHAVGINQREPLDETSDEVWDAILRTNLTSAFWFARAAIDHLRRGTDPRIVVFTSVSAWMAHPHHGAYAASKGGLQQLVRVLAVELASSGIQVNAVAPGYVETSLTADYLARPGVRDELEAKVPAGRLGAIDDVVNPVLFLSSPRSSFVTGHSIVVDGGRSLD